VPDEPWPIAETPHDGCTRFGLPEGVGPPEVGARLRPFEELGIDDWRREALAVLVRSNRPFGVSASRPSWRMTNLSRLGRPGRAAWRAGVRWQKSFSGAVWVTVPATATSVRQNVLASLGCGDEMMPESIIVPAAALVDERAWRQAQAWCATPAQWSVPDALLARVAEQIIVLHDGWLFIAAAPPAVADVRRAIHALAGRWGVRIVPGPQTWSWFPAGGERHSSRFDDGHR
jgi:hypothetical protein